LLYWPFGIAARLGQVGGGGGHLLDHRRHLAHDLRQQRLHPAHDGRVHEQCHRIAGIFAARGRGEEAVQLVELGGGETAGIGFGQPCAHVRLELGHHRGHLVAHHGHGKIGALAEGGIKNGHDFGHGALADFGRFLGLQARQANEIAHRQRGHAVDRLPDDGVHRAVHDLGIGAGREDVVDRGGGGL
jgi:hypothetical protein